MNPDQMGARPLWEMVVEAPTEVHGEVQIMPCVRRHVQINNGAGLHLRVANQFIQVSQQFQVEVRVSCNGHAANCRSILDLLCLAAQCGDHLELEVSGPGAEQAISALCELVQARFPNAEDLCDDAPTTRFL